MSISFSGLASGLDTSGWVEALVSVKQEKITTILVSHDLSESISMSNRIIVLSKRPAKIKKIYQVN